MQISTHFDYGLETNFAWKQSQSSKTSHNMECNIFVANIDTQIHA